MRLPLSLSFHPPCPGELFDPTQPTDGSPRSRQHLKGFFFFFFTTPPTPPFLLFMSLSLLCATCVRPHALARLFGNAAIMTSACFRAQTARRRPAAGSEAPGESSGATLTSRGRAANSFPARTPLPRLPSSSTYSSHLLTDPSDRGPALALLPPRRHHQASFALRGGGERERSAAPGFQELCVHT